jgi:hypothetical protein
MYYITNERKLPAQRMILLPVEGIFHIRTATVLLNSFSCHIQTMLLKEVFSNIISMIRHKRASDKYIY